MSLNDTLDQIYNDHAKEITIIYTENHSLGLQTYFGRFLISNSNRVIIPPSFKKDKTILMVCEGKVKILNRYGDRLLMEENKKLA